MTPEQTRTQPSSARLFESHNSAERFHKVDRNDTVAVTVRLPGRNQVSVMLPLHISGEEAVPLIEDAVGVDIDMVTNVNCA